MEGRLEPRVSGSEVERANRSAVAACCSICSRVWRSNVGAALKIQSKIPPKVSAKIPQRIERPYENTVPSDSQSTLNEIIEKNHGSQTRTRSQRIRSRARKRLGRRCLLLRLFMGLWLESSTKFPRPRPNPRSKPATKSDSKQQWPSGLRARLLTTWSRVRVWLRSVMRIPKPLCSDSRIRPQIEIAIREAAANLECHSKLSSDLEIQFRIEIAIRKSISE